MYKPRNDLVLVEKIVEEKSVSGIVLPTDQGYTALSKFRVLSVGPQVSDLKLGDIILAEDASQEVDKVNKNIRIINQKYIHLIKDGK